MDGPAAVVVSGLTKSYGPVVAVAGRRPAHRARGGVRAARPERGRQDHDVEILEGYRRRDAGEVAVLGLDPGRQRSKLKPRIGIVLQSTGVDRYLTVAETIAMYSGYYPHPRPGGRGHRGRRPERQAQQPGRAALRRPAAAPRRRDRAGRRSRPALPRRADHRLRPVRPARGVAGGQEPRRARQDRAADHPLHGRGAVPGRPGRGHRGRPHRRRGHAGHAGRAGHGPGEAALPAAGRRRPAGRR